MDSLSVESEDSALGLGIESIPPKTTWLKMGARVLSKDNSGTLKWEKEGMDVGKEVSK